MTEMFLEVAPRTQRGKGPARKMRSSGTIPGVIYGLHSPITIQVNGRIATKLVHQLHGAERMISLRIADEPGGGQTEKHVLVKEVQTHPVNHQVLHIDFLEVEVNKRVQVTVELHPTGISEGVRLGGVLQAVKHEIQIECLPLDIPEFIEFDVSALKIGDSLHVKDLVFSEGISPVTDLEETLVVISAPRVEEVETTEEEAAADAVPVVGASTEAADADKESGGA